MLTVQEKMEAYIKGEQKKKLRRQIALAKEELRKKDYIGRKIAEALLFNDEVKLIELRAQYREEIENANALRNSINQWQAELDELSNN